MATRIQLRGDLEANWTAENPVLAEREMAIETDTNRYKIGNGSLAWNVLPYSSFSGISTVIGGDNITNSGTYSSPTMDLDDEISLSTVSAVTFYENAVDISAKYAPKTMPYEFIVAISDEDSQILVGTPKVTFLAPADFTLSGVTASLTNSGTTSSQFDVNNNGVTVFSTPLTIDANELDSRTAATPAIISGGTISQYDRITIDIDSAGLGATGVKILFTGSRTY